MPYGSLSNLKAKLKITDNTEDSFLQNLLDRSNLELDSFIKDLLAEDSNIPNNDLNELVELHAKWKYFLAIVLDNDNATDKVAMEFNRYLKYMHNKYLGGLSL